MVLNDLLLLSGNDIPFIEAEMTIHQPTIKEIAYLGEDNFFSGCQMLNFSKNLLSEEDKVNLESQSNFDILIAILGERNAVMQKNRNCTLMVLALLFPEYQIAITKDSFEFKKENEKHHIDNSNFEEFKSIINQIFQLTSKDDPANVNPSGEMAKRIAEKLQRRHQKLAEQKGEKKVDILSRYVSILAVGENKDMNALLNYTFYQLFDEIERYQLKISYDMYIQAKMAGAKDLKEVDDWMKDIHSVETQDKI
jgi:hypothetical protein